MAVIDHNNNLDRNPSLSLSGRFTVRGQKIGESKLLKKRNLMTFGPLLFLLLNDML